MRFASVVIALLAVSCLLCIITTTCSAQSAAPSFQSVSGEFARTWITSNKAQISQPVQESPGNGSDLWNWGKAPKGSKIENGKLLTDPYYLRPLLNLSSNWLGETYTDPDTGLPVQIYLDPLTGKTTYTYLDPNSGRPIFSYSFISRCQDRGDGVCLYRSHDGKCNQFRRCSYQYYKFDNEWFGAAVGYEPEWSLDEIVD